MWEAISYTRVSTEEQAEHGTSLAGQAEANQRTAQNMSARIVAHYEDAGVSGAAYVTRYGLQKALADLEMGKANMLIVYDVTRLSRDVEHLSAIVKRIRAAGARLVFHNGQFEDTPEGEMLLSVNGVFSQYERRKLRERSINGKLRRVKEGKQPCVGIRPYGYHIISKDDVTAERYPEGTNGTYVILEEEAVWVREIYARYYAGHSLREIARWLQGQGVLPPSHAPDRLERYETPPRPVWHANTIAYMLLNSVYKGMATYGKYAHKVDEGRLQKGMKRKDYNERLEPDKWKYVAADVPPIVEADVWDACQTRKQQNKATRGGNPTNRYLFTGFLICPNCEKRMAGAKSRKGDREHICYRCKDYSKSSCSDGFICNKRHYGENVLLRQVRTGVEGCTPLLESAFDAYNLSLAQEDITPRLMQIQRDLNALDTRERAAVEGELTALSAGRNASVYHKVLQEVDAQRKALQANYAVLEAQRQTRPALDAKGYAQVVQESLENLWMVLEASEEEVSTGEKNALLARVIDRITPGEETTEIRLHPRKNGATVTCICTFFV